MENTNEALKEFESRLYTELGDRAASAAMLILIRTLGGIRLTIPTISQLSRDARNKRIRQLFHGGNYHELAARFGVNPTTVRRIVHGKRNKERENHGQYNING